MTTLKLQFSNYEEGEFTKEQSVDYSTFIEIFEKEANNIVYSKYSWTLENNWIKYFLNIDNTYYLLIEHVAKDVYSLTFCDCNEKYVFKKKLYNQTLIYISKLFFDNDFEGLKGKLTKSNERISDPIRKYKPKTFEYSYAKKAPKYLIYQLSIKIIFFSFLIYFIINSKILILSIFPLYVLVETFFLIRIHFNHLNESINKSIKISSGNEKIILTINNSSIEFTKSEINKAILFIMVNGRNPFYNYGYTQLILKDDSVVNIPNMILDPSMMNYKIKNVKKEIKSKTYAYIKPKTNIIQQAT